MTRQKKEIKRKINEIETEIAVDEALSYGCHPADAYDWLYEQIDKLNEQLAKLRHYGSAMEMLFDPRGQDWNDLDPDLPF